MTTFINKEKIMGCYIAAIKKEELTPLKALETIKEITSSREQGFNTKLKNDVYYQKELNIIEKSLKALEIIKEKMVDIHALKYACDLESYNIHKWSDCKKLTQDEYKLIKEILL